MGMTKAAKILLIWCLIVAGVLHSRIVVAATLRQSDVTLTGVVCHEEATKFHESHERPELFVDYGNKASQKTLYTGYRSAANSFSLRAEVSPGFHTLFVLANFGAASIPLDVLLGHSRYITFSMCNGLEYFDSVRSIAVRLPSAGLIPFLVVTNGNTNRIIPMSIEDGIAYAMSLPSGKLSLVVAYTSGLPQCEYSLNVGARKVARQHIYVRLAVMSLSMVGLAPRHACKAAAVILR